MEAADRENAMARTAKAYMNMGLTKSMSSNHKFALQISEKALPIIEQLKVSAEEARPEDGVADNGKG